MISSAGPQPLHEQRAGIGTRRRVLARRVFLALCTILSSPAQAHEIRPGYLALVEVGNDRFDVVFKVPTVSGARLRMYARLPENCLPLIPPSTHVAPTALLERSTVRCEGGLAGQSIGIDGLEVLITDVLVRIERLDGEPVTHRLRPSRPSFIVPAAPSRWKVAGTYLGLGIEHILGGVDHLLFVLALLLLVRQVGLLVKTITAFTVAHSITLALATVGMARVPGAPVEAVIALSILFLASEILRTQSGRAGLTVRYPWVVAFTFGLLHGLGFAGALAEVGLPQTAIPLALLPFNVGVEVGQLLFVTAALGIVAGVRRVRSEWPGWAEPLPAYGIGSVAAFWCIERVATFW